ncbi:MAG: hypothetical protein QOJ09_973, partial [Actinomycetota bacterium]|nr:hypothetical protein [Actinomycetota bacterium]
MATELVDRAPVDMDEWACACGRVVPRGISLCPTCGRPSPYGDWIQPLPRAPRQVRGIRLAFGVIGLNVVTQAVMLAMVSAGRMDSGRAITLAMWIGLGFYGVVLAMLAGPLLSLRPRWLAGNRQTAPVLGIEVGLAAAAGLITLFWLGAGHPVLDPSARAMVSEGSLGRTLLAFLVIACAAPVVEELLFRGVVAES